MVAGQLKEHLRVLLLRIESTFSGLRTCLPDFSHPTGELSIPTLAGSSGVTVGSSALREEAAEIIHQACEYVHPLLIASIVDCCSLRLVSSCIYGLSVFSIE